MKKTFFFDLDGTLIDTALDLSAAANRTFETLGYAPLPDAQLRQHVSGGSGALLIQRIPEEELESARAIMLADYLANLAQKTIFFKDIESMLLTLDSPSVCWGILTNKPRYLSEPLLAEMMPWWSQKHLFCGPDFTAVKPDPMSLNAVAQQYNVDLSQAYYIGDHRKDIQTAQSAGWHSISVEYGYHDPKDPPACWQADLNFQTSTQLAQWILNQL